MKKAWRLIEALLVTVLMLTIVPQKTSAADKQEARTDNYLRNVKRKGE